MTDIFYALVTVAVIGLLLSGSKWGMAALAFSLPISSRLPSLPIPVLNTQNFIVLSGFFWLIRNRGTHGKSGRVTFALPLLALAIVVTFAYVKTVAFFEPFRYQRWFNEYTITVNYKALIFCFLIYLLGCLVAGRKEDAETAFLGILAGTAFEGAFVCLEVVLNGPARANGHLIEPNAAGAYLSWAATVGLSAFLARGREGRMGRLAVVTAVAAGFGLIFTLSRGNWIALMASAGLVTAVKDKRVLVLLVVGLMAYPLWLPQKAQSRINETFEEEEGEAWQVRRAGDTQDIETVNAIGALLGGSEGEEGGGGLDRSSQVRLYVWLAALRMIGDNPLGVGFGLFQFYLPDYSTVYEFRAAHNTYLLLAAETGVLGLFFFLLLIGCLMFESGRAYRIAGDKLFRAIALAAAGSMLSMLISAFFYNVMFFVHINGQQWLLLGLATQMRRLSSARPEEPAGGEPAAAPGPVPLYELARRGGSASLLIRRGDRTQ